MHAQLETWHDVWERKGKVETDNLRELNGYEQTTANTEFIANTIKVALDIKPNDRVLEVGCGAGMLASYLDCNYIGMDYSASLVKKHIKILNNSVIHGSANDLIFKDRSFDKVFCFGVFHYFPDIEYANTAIAEMRRVSKGSIFIGDLPIRSHRKEHLLFDPKKFTSFEISDGLYNPDRFNIFLKK
jgi:ubiquinone/menaquinone biosynthesis C-methylase UbiE